MVAQYPSGISDFPTCLRSLQCLLLCRDTLLTEGYTLPTKGVKLDSLHCRFYESEDEIHRLFRSINGVILPVSAVLCTIALCVLFG